MPSNRTRFMVQTPNGPRTLFSVIEKSNGELTITLKTGGYFGAPRQSDARVTEHRYSIHTSPKSPDYNVMKLTINLDDGRSVTLASLTDAMKRRDGFFTLLVRRCENLSRLDEPTRNPNKDRILVLGEYDPSLWNLYYGIFLGHPDVRFDARSSGIGLNEFAFEKFKIVVACSYFPLPSYHTTDFVHSLTIPPESDPEGPELARFLMRGRTPAICLTQYNNAKRFLARRLIEFVLEHEELEAADVELLKNDREQIGEVDLIDLGPALGQPAIFMSNATTPGPLSERLHAEFIQLKVG